MKALLFCNLPYSFAILQPISEVLKSKNINVLWFVSENLLDIFPYSNQSYTSDIKEAYTFSSDMIFVPGNHVPWFLAGVKVQVFHGLAGEKKGHFRIRDYFDLYLTQGPYFTDRFEALKKQHGDFEVVQTGWSKLDVLYQDDPGIEIEKSRLLEQSGAEKIILYAPTFSPSLTSTRQLLPSLEKLAKSGKYLIMVKFHDKHNEEDRKRYAQSTNRTFCISKDDSINNLLRIADLMISDTSSAVYEFLLLDKPVITLDSHSENINWLDISDPQILYEQVVQLFEQGDEFSSSRKKVIDHYHPYDDGCSAERMVDATLGYIQNHGIPKQRKVPLGRKLQILKKYGYPPLSKYF